MAKFNAKAIAEMKEVFKKAQYVNREWTTNEQDIIPVKDYAELIDNTMAHISDNPTIIAKERKDGNIFLKMWIPLEGGSGMEHDLSYEDDTFEEGDVIDKDSLCFCVEKFFDKKHGYVTGTVI